MLAVLLTALFLAPDLLFYVYWSSKPWCSSCEQRPAAYRPNPTAAWVLVILLMLIVLYMGAWVYALATGTAQ